MTPEQLFARITAHEDNFTERKSEGVSPSEVRRTACAFANSLADGEEAVLFIGIHDKTGEIVGVKGSDAVQKNVRQHVLACYPPVQYSATVLEVEGRQVVAVVFAFSASKPHFTGPAFVRQGSESINASPAQFEELILSRHDVAREILRHKNDIFTVRGIGYRLGSNRPLADQNYVEGCECRLISCTGHLVSLRDIGTDRLFSEPVANVTIARDEARNRPMLLVRFR